MANESDTLEFIVKLRDEASKVSSTITAEINKQTTALEKNAAAAASVNREADKTQRRRPTQYGIMPTVDPKQVEQLNKTREAVTKLQDAVSPRNAQSFMMSPDQITAAMNKALGNDNVATSSRGGFGQTMKDHEKSVGSFKESLTNVAPVFEAHAKRLREVEDHLAKANGQGGSGGWGAYGAGIRGITTNFLGLTASIAGGVAAGIGLTNVLAQISNTAGEVVTTLVNQERAQKLLDSALDVTKVSLGMTREELKKYLHDVGDTYFVDQTKLTHATASLVQLGGVTEDTFKPSIELAMRLSEVLGGDVTSSAQMLARAMNEPQLALQMLRRAGISLDEQQKREIKTLEIVEGKRAAASAIIRELTKNLGGMDAAQSRQGLSGAIDNAKNAWHGFLMSFQGGVIEGALTSAMNSTADFVREMTKLFDISEKFKKFREQTAGTGAGEPTITTPKQHPFAFSRLVPPQSQSGGLDADEKETLRRKIEEMKRLRDQMLADDPGGTMYVAGEIKDLEDAIALLERRLGGVTQARKDALGSDAVKDIEEIRKHVTALATNLGLVADTLGGIKTKALDDAEKVYKGTQKALADAQATGNAQLIEQATRLNEAARLKVLDADATTKQTQALEDQQKAARAGLVYRDAELQRINAVRQAKKDGKSDEEAARAGQVAFDAAAFRVNQTMGDQAAAFSRQVRNARELARAYDISTVAANNLSSAQQAAENAATGKGGGNADMIQFEKFMQTLIRFKAGTSEAFDELIYLERQAAAAADPVAANLARITEGAQKLNRELTNQIPRGGNDQLTQEALNEKAAAVRKQAVADVQRYYLTVTKGANEEIAKGKEAIELNQKKSEYAKGSIKDEEIAIGLLKIEQEARKLLAASITAERESDKQRLKELYDQAMAAMDAQKQSVREVAESNEAYRRASGPLSQFIRSGQDQWRDYEQAIVSAMTGTEDALAAILTGTKDWQSAMSDLINSVIQDFAKLAMRSMMSGVADNIGSWLGKAAGMIGGYFMGGGGGAVAAGSGTLFAGGGIMTKDGPLPLRKYAGGGIANSPQVAIFGEGSTPEAYVPVPNGRIPVELKGSRGGVNMPTEINITINNGGQGSGGSGGGQDPASMRRQADQIASLIKSALNKHIQEQMRPGGLLNPAGNYSPQGMMV